MLPPDDAPPTQGAWPRLPGNRLLAALTRGERAFLQALLAPMPLRAGQVLIEPGAEVSHLVLPESGLASVILAYPDGSGGEVGLVGREGVIGLPALLGEPFSPFRVVVRIPGAAQTAPLAALRALADRSANLRDLIRRHALAALLEAGTVAACHASHRLEGRAARWLLTASDRVGAPGFPLTQEGLARSLGAQRPTVNGVLVAFQQAGLVRHARGQVAVADAAGLEGRACPCHAALRDSLRRLMPGSGPLRRSAPEGGAEVSGA